MIAFDTFIFFRTRQSKRSTMREFDTSSYKQQKELGRGSFGIVHAWKRKAKAKRRGQHSVQHVATDAHTAVSIVTKRFMSGSGKGITYDCVREISCLKALGKHPNIVNMLGIATHGDMCEPLLVLETMDESISGLVRKTKQLGYADSYRVYLMISSGVRHMHNLGFMHRDLKPGNILCSQCYDVKSCIVKVADFGLATRYVKGRSNTLEVQTLYWRAPEVLLKDVEYTPALDIWSVALIYLEMIGHDQSLIEGDSEYGQLIKCFQLLGKPSVEEWPRLSTITGVDQREEWPQFPPKDLIAPLTRYTADEKRKVQFLLENMLCFDPAKRSMPVISAADWKYREEQLIQTPLRKKMTNVARAWRDQAGVNLKMRTDLFDWLLHTATQYRLDRRTYFLGLCIVDRYVDLKPREMLKLPLVGMAGLHIACLVNETYPLRMTDWRLVSGDAYAIRDIEECVCTMCHTLEYDFYNYDLLIDMFEYPPGGYDVSTWGGETAEARQQRNIFEHPARRMDMMYFMTALTVVYEHEMIENLNNYDEIADEITAQRHELLARHESLFERGFTDAIDKVIDVFSITMRQTAPGTHTRTGGLTGITGEMKRAASFSYQPAKRIMDTPRDPDPDMYLRAGGVASQRDAAGPTTGEQQTGAHKAKAADSQTACEEELKENRDFSSFRDAQAQCTKFRKRRKALGRNPKPGELDCRRKRDVIIRNLCRFSDFSPDTAAAV